MNIKEIQPNSQFTLESAKIIEKGDIRTFQKFGKDGKVCSCTLEDDSGKVTLSLWNEQIDQFENGDTISIENGWAKEWNGQIQVSAGKGGTITKK